MRVAWFLGVFGAGAALALSAARDARACGGCFHPPAQSGTVVTDHRMIFSVAPQETTLYDEIKYQGSPSSFAWVLPIQGQVRVALSSDLLFASIDQVTTTSILAPPLPPCGCISRGAGGVGGPVALAPTLSGGGGGAPAVTVLTQQVVGPYDTVQLQSTDPMALTTWLTANGYQIPASIQPVIAAYVAEGFDFLAMRLSPGQGIQAMQPVSVTSGGAGLSLPLRMVAAGTGATVGITLWVVATGRYQPQNFPNFVITPSELVWDWSSNSSNYSTVRAMKEAALNDAAWQIESSIDVGPYQIEQLVLNGPAAPNYTAIPTTDAGPGETAEQVRAIDLATCFPAGGANVRITRMRADLSQAALANDLVLTASPDQNTLSQNYQLTQAVNVPACPCPLTDAGTIVGGGGSSGGFGGFGGGGATTTDGGSPGSGASAGDSFGCSSAAEKSPPAGFEIALAGLLGAALVRARTRRRR
jgi:MYXO-CTERM domain-containing protein